LPGEVHTPFTHFKCLRGQLNMSRATFDTRATSYAGPVYGILHTAT
jgi:hypothetical protein